MGRKVEFTDEQVIAAVKAIESEGKSVSTFAIRNKLKGGSSERIKDVWDAYKTNCQSAIKKGIADKEIELPSEIQEALKGNQRAAMTHLENYRIAQQIAEKRVSSTIEEYKAKIIEFEDSEREASFAIESSDKKTEDLELDIESLSLKNEKIQAENSHLTGLLESMQERINKLEAKEDAYNQLQREFGKLEGKIAILSSNKI